MNSNNLKLYVIGQHSPNPDEWLTWSTTILVFAESPEQAIAHGGDLAIGDAMQVKGEGAVMLCQLDGASFG